MRQLVYLTLVFITLFACSRGSNNDEHPGHDHAAAKERAPTYTCPMHPDVVRDAPGQCPICGMDLVRVNTAESGSMDLMLSESQMRLANITTQKVSMRPVGQTVAVNARLLENQELTAVVSSRAAGRIEKLYVKETGRMIQQGEPLYDLYSETLLTLQNEYLLARQQFETLGGTEKRYASFLKAAERKLLLYGLTQSQINKLAAAKAVEQRITFVAPASGIVTELNVAEGQYVSEGSMLLRLENISKLWLEAELYPSEASLMKTGDQIDIRVSGFEGMATKATVTFLSPEYRSNSQVVLMRAAIDNKSLSFKPGMQAQALFTHSAKKALAIPTDAVIRDGTGSHVYIQTGLNTFRPQIVRTGLENFDQVEITAGLQEGDTVAVTGAYLLYSEIVLKKGMNPMAAHNHQEMTGKMKTESN